MRLLRIGAAKVLRFGDRIAEILGIPVGAILEENGDPILTETGDYIEEE